MDFWYALIGIIALIVSFPYIRCFFKRLKCADKIKRLFPNKRYKIPASHPLWFLGSKHANESQNLNIMEPIRRYAYVQKESHIDIFKKAEYC